MSFYFPQEYATTVEGADGYVFLSQENDDGTTDIVQLTVHQFEEIYNRSKHIIADARGENELAKV